MKRSLALILIFVLRLVLKLRYRVTLVGQPQLLKRPGTLILANHPALIDPCLVTAYLWPHMKFHAVGGDFLEQDKLIRKAFSIYGVVYVPGFDVCSNSYKRYRIDQAYAQIIDLLKQGENVLIYPAGGLKTSGLDLIGGNSGLHHILQSVPHVNLLLVKSTGLWGSLFSKALTGKTPDILGAFWRGFKILLKNGIFFTPRRRVVLEFQDATEDFPRYGRRRDINSYLEQWFNQHGPETLSLVSYSCWKVVLPVIEQQPESQKITLADIPEPIQQRVKEEVANLAAVPAEQIRLEQDLSFDLGLDSLDRAQLVLFLKESFGITGVTGVNLTTVGDVMGIAAKQIVITSQDVEEIEFKTPDWEDISGRPIIEYPHAPTLLEGFLHTCDRMNDWVAAVDPNLGEVNYKRLKLAVILFAKLIKRCEGDKIGILFPASIAANIMILATQLAGKVPVMINWTLGKRNLHSILEQINLKTTISSWKFLDQLENVDLNGLNEQIVTVEELKRQISLGQKIQAYALSRKKPKELLKAFGQQNLNAHSRAVILFTSGTESRPKGVPLTHGNLIENQRTAFSMIAVHPNDALLSFLPP
ncbi:MAG: AMP-binding protein, partial [Verrucomicrobia bacterium]|nr:AMP-binding protein [Verrucomicrobiota bacterium]